MTLDNILHGNISVSYTLKTDDITKGEHPGGTPYVSRTGVFDENGYNADTRSQLIVKEIEDGVSLTLSTESDDLSEFGLNLPFNFMGKKNGGGWRNQYLFNSPYSSKDNKFIYCYLTNPEGRNLMLVFSSDADGNALCCGHAWTIWRAEADYWYYHLTGDEEYLRRSLCGFTSNFAKIDANGKSYACYQPDYITGGGLNSRCEDVVFRIAKGFPKQSDSGLSRYAWIRYYEVFLKNK